MGEETTGGDVVRPVVTGMDVAKERDRTALTAAELVNGEVRRVFGIPAHLVGRPVQVVFPSAEAVRVGMADLAHRMSEAVRGVHKSLIGFGQTMGKTSKVAKWMAEVIRDLQLESLEARYHTGRKQDRRRNHRIQRRRLNRLRRAMMLAGEEIPEWLL